jgi:O-antigen ligase
MTAEPLQIVGMLAACGGAAAALVIRDERTRLIAIAIALLAAPALVAGDVWDQSRVVDLRSDPAHVAAGLLATLAVLGVGAALFRRVPAAFPIAAFAVIPLRLPVQLGGETSNLLLPLYAVIASAFVAAVLAHLRDEGDARDARTEPLLALWLRRLLAATLVLYGIQSIYSDDLSNAIENAGFFLVPFAVLFLQLVEVRWDRELLGWVLRVLAAIGLVLAAVAFGEYATRDLILNEQLQDANQIHLYFRVNSLFHDPNIFGRYLALMIVALGGYLAWARSAAWAWAAAGTALVLTFALMLTFSLTGFAALMAGLLVIALLRFGFRWALVAAALMLVATVIFVAAGGADRSSVGPERGLRAETSGRTSLVSGGVDLAKDRPIWGWGSGAFGRAYVDQIEVAKTTTSHSEPITVAAEQGVIGFVLYIALLVVSLMLLFSERPGASVGRATVAACYVAMIIHSLGYAGFDIDPVTWALLALGVALASTDATREPA